jgi:AraC family transcriptional regulator of adaptative response / DNA-3-methyladenine glycosylase II
MPARRNVRFFPSAAAAEGAGLRPCLRCRPETAPGSPAAAGTSALVSRALRLIDGGALDEGSVETLASRLGVTSRWLRQLFDRHLGAAPLEVAQTRRAHLARRLIETSALPLEDVAAATGYGSARRMRHAIRRSFGRPARTLRGRSSRPLDPGLRLDLRARGSFDPEPLFRFLSPRAIPLVERMEPGVWRRTFGGPNGAGVVEVSASPRGDGLRVSLRPPAPGTAASVVARVTRVFDLDADVRGIAAELRRDPLLRRVMPAAGVRVAGAWDAFEMGVRAIVGQQVSVAGAITMLGRLVERCGTPLAQPEDALTRLFPTAAQVAAAELDGLGLTGARVTTLRGFARQVADGSLDLEALTGLEIAVARLTQLPGIGAWTAHEIALRSLREPDAFPAGDLGIRRALATNGRLPAERDVRARAESWRPWRAYAATALWAADPGMTPRKESKS